MRQQRVLLAFSNTQTDLSAHKWKNGMVSLSHNTVNLFKYYHLSCSYGILLMESKYQIKLKNILELHILGEKLKMTRE